MFEVEQRSFISEEKYNELINRFKDKLNYNAQISYYFSGEKDFRIMLTKDYIQMWLKEGKMHDDSREEHVVKLDNTNKNELLALLNCLGYNVEIKWFRKRNEMDHNGYDLTIDYTVGYGYIIEVEKRIDDESLIEQTKKELIGLLNELGVDISAKEEFKNKFEDYKLNYLNYTSDIDEEEFIRVDN